MHVEPNLSLYAPCAAKPVTETLSIRQGKGLRRRQRKGSEGKPQFLLTQFRLEQVFIILRVGVVYILMKRVGKLMIIHENIRSMRIEQVCNIPLSVWGGDNIKTRQNSASYIRRPRRGDMGSESKYKLDGHLGSLSREGMQGVAGS